MGLFDHPKKEKPDFGNVVSGSSTSGSAPPQGRRTYTVQRGDSLSGIAEHQYGNAQKWRLIYEANRDLIKDPDVIYPGQTLTIPDADRGGTP